MSTQTQALKGTAANYFSWALNMCLCAGATGLFVDIIPEDGRLRDFGQDEEMVLGQSFERMAAGRFKDFGTVSRVHCGDQTSPEVFYVAVAHAVRTVEAAIQAQRLKEEREAPLRPVPDVSPDVSGAAEVSKPGAGASGGMPAPGTSGAGFMSNPKSMVYDGRNLGATKPGQASSGGPSTGHKPVGSDLNKKDSSSPIAPHIFIVQDVDRAPARTMECLAEMLAVRTLSAPPGMTVGVLPDMLQLPPLFLVVAMSSRIPRPSATTNFSTDPSEGRLSDRLVSGFFMRIPIVLPKTTPPQTVGPPRLTRESLKSLVESAHRVQIHPSIIKYVRDCVSAVRSHPLIACGLPPRASDVMFQAMRAHAALRGSRFVVPDDVSQCLIEVLAHRVIIVPSDLLPAELTEHNAVHLSRYIIAAAVSSIPVIK